MRHLALPQRLPFSTYLQRLMSVQWHSQDMHSSDESPAGRRHLETFLKRCMVLPGVTQTRKEAKGSETAVDGFNRKRFRLEEEWFVKIVNSRLHKPSPNWALGR
jgi:hypothetical protein